jgi:RNA polymerase sigma-70 factor (ECF subfamily)
MKSNNKQKDAFLRAYDEHSDGLFRYALFKTSNRELALDIVQDTFTNVWEYIAKGGKIDNIKAFLYRTLGNKIIDSYRKKQSESLDNLMSEGYDIGFDDRKKMEDLLMGESVWAKVTEMEPVHIEILTLRYMNDLSIKEIANIIDQSENSVSVKIHRALEKLKEKLEN